MVVSDLDDVFVPLPDDLLVNLSESRSVVDVFLDSLPSMFQDNINVESAFGPALKASLMLMVGIFFLLTQIEPCMFEINQSLLIYFTLSVSSVMFCCFLFLHFVKFSHSFMLR